MILEIREDISSNLKKCQCDKCGAVGNFTYHASYKRYLIKISSSEQITIDRVKCRSCGATHALIPKDIIPYKQYAVSLVVLLFIMWADISKRKKRQDINVPETTRRRLVNDCRKDASILLAITINQDVVKNKCNYFENTNFVIVC